MMLKGSCLCSQVAYEIDAPLGHVVHCHCATCRKAHSTAFSSVCEFPRDKFHVIRGGTLLKAYESSPGKKRYFCTNCGSQIYAARENQDYIVLRLGCLDSKITKQPKATHIWRSDAAPWYDPKELLPEFPEGVK